MLRPAPFIIPAAATIYEMKEVFGEVVRTDVLHNIR